MPLKLTLYIAAFLAASASVASTVSAFNPLPTGVDTSTDGYYLDSLHDVAAAGGPGTFQCPSDNVITTRYKCNVSGQWVDCTRKHCCPDYIFIANKCIPKDQDPCQMKLCEQRCTVFLQRVVCTCFDGYKFSPENQKKGLKPVCIDVNECEDKNGDCQHECINEVGSYRCECRPGYELRPDNRSCQSVSGQEHADILNEDALAASRGHCYANCDTVLRLHEKVKILQEKILALSTAVRMASFASGPPGPAGPTGPAGPPGPRGFPGQEATTRPTTAGGDGAAPQEDYTYSMLDAFVPVPADGQSGFCRCKRGALGPPGATGSEGPKGEKGERGQRGPKGEQGSLDFVLLLLADLRHDVMHLQSRVYKKGEKPPQFDLNTALKKQRIKEKQRTGRQNKLLPGYSVPPVEIIAPVAGDTETHVFNTAEQSSTSTAHSSDYTQQTPAAVGPVSFDNKGPSQSLDNQKQASMEDVSLEQDDEDDSFILAEYTDYDSATDSDETYENYYN